MNPVDRRSFLRSSAFAAAGTATLVGSSASAAQPAAKPDARRASPKRYAMKKSINLWAFPYPDRMNLRECLQLAKDAGFDGIELNYNLDNDLSPKATAKDFKAIRQMADQIGIQISGLCSFLFWPYPLVSNDAAKRARGLELAGMIGQAAQGGEGEGEGEPAEQNDGQPPNDGGKGGTVDALHHAQAECAASHQCSGIAAADHDASAKIRREMDALAGHQ